jgi:phosphate-selective porin OprO/OprP
MKPSHRPGLAVAALIGALAFQGPAAADPGSDRLLEILVNKGILTQEEAEQVRMEAEAPRPSPLETPVSTDVQYDPVEPFMTTEEQAIRVRRLAIDSADGADRFSIRGRLQFDVGRQDFGDGIPDVARQGHDFPKYGAMFRRLRLGALGIMHNNWEWQLEVDFAENEIDLANAYMAYLMPHGRLAFGHFKEPFGLEYATSSRRITFIERSAASDAYKVNREPGIMYETLRPNWYGAVGVFGGGIDFNREIEEGWALSGRLTAAPYLDGANYIHVGAAINQRRNAVNKASNLYEPVRLRTREGMRVIDARLIGRDDLEGVSKFTRHGLEFAAGLGPWAMQSEYLWVDIDLDRAALERALGTNATTANSLTQKGWYAQTSYFLTGEHSNYRAFSGDYGRVTPHANFAPRQGTWGAWEVALRYSVADSLEHTRPGRGQKLDHWTLGLNWYLNPEVIVKFNVIYLEGERDVFEDDGWVYGARFQYEF